MRRYDIDWIRVLVFDILILFHVGMFFNVWDWHLKNDVTLEGLSYPMLFFSQWRIPILFVVSGMGTRFALSHRTGKQYVKERFTRLFIPLVVGMLVVVPPQVYLERLADGDFSGSFWAFYPHYFEPIYPTGNLSWHHLWFLPYLLLMSVAATPLFLKWRNEDNGLTQWLRQKLAQSPWCLYLFAIPLFLVEASLGAHFPITHALYNDFYALAYYFLLFLSGFLLITLRDAFWDALEKIRTRLLVLAIVFTITLMFLYSNYRNEWFLAVVKTLNMWTWILAIFGYAAKYLNKESKVVKYRNEAVYPFYIIHQTITVIIGFYLIDHPMPIFWKFVIMVVGTFGGAWVFFETVKRVWFLRPLFGLKNK